MACARAAVASETPAAAAFLASVTEPLWPCLSLASSSPSFEGALDLNVPSSVRERPFAASLLFLFASSCPRQPPYQSVTGSVTGAMYVAGKSSLSALLLRCEKRRALSAQNR